MNCPLLFYHRLLLSHVQILSKHHPGHRNTVLNVQYWSRRLACATLWWRTEAKQAIVFTYFFFFFFFFFFYAFCFSHTSGNVPCMTICFPQYFGITRRNIFFFKLCDFYFFTKILQGLRVAQAAVTERWP